MPPGPGPDAKTPGTLEDDRARKDTEDRQRDEDPLDPGARQAAQLAPPPGWTSNVSPPLGVTAPVAAKPVEASARASLEALVPALVRRIAWGGDGRRGSVRIELGAGGLSGATVVVHADAGRVRVELSVPSGVDGEEWRQRIAERLAARGIDLDHVVLR